MEYENTSSETESKRINSIQTSKGTSSPPFEDNRPENQNAIELQNMVNNSSQSKDAMEMQDMADEHSKKEEQYSPIPRKNNTGLPDNLKAGMEQLFGYSLDPVKVHYNSSKPEKVNAKATTEGYRIDLASGQEKHISHELGHVIQQIEGRVKPTTTVNGFAINDDEGLEKEAEELGEKALALNLGLNDVRSDLIHMPIASKGVIQRVNLEQDNITADNVQDFLSRKFAESGWNKEKIANYPSDVYERIRHLLVNSEPFETFRVPGAGFGVMFATDKSYHEGWGYLKTRKMGHDHGIGHLGRLSEEGIGGNIFDGVIGEDEMPMMENSFDANGVMPKVMKRVAHQGMGESPTVVSGRHDAEWLHCIAHSLGGADGPTNVMLGPHYLNTAMIAFEQMMATLYSQNSPITYSVKFYPNGTKYQGFPWVGKISLELIDQTAQVAPLRFVLQDPYPDGESVPQDYRLNEEYFNFIKQKVQEWCVQAKVSV